jgi:hypothetical protein
MPTGRASPAPRENLTQTSTSSRPKVVKNLGAQFGEIRLSGSEDDPRVDLQLIGVDTEGIIRDNRHADDDAGRRKLVRDMFWGELKLKEEGTFETRATVVWRGTGRAVDVLMDNICDPDRMPNRRFEADPGTIRMIIDYPFDEANRYPSDDVLRVNDIKGQLGDENTLIWLPHFLSDDRKADLSTLIVINYLLERDRLAEVTPTWTADDRHHARTQLESRRSALSLRLLEAIRRAYGVNSPDDADLGPRAPEQVMTLARDLQPRLQVGQGLRGAFERLCFALLDQRFKGHPDFDPNGRGLELRLSELQTVADAVDHAAQDKVGRYEPPRQHIATLKKIANPLKIGVMHEAAFVLGQEWPSLINRKAGAATQVTVGQLRGWIDEEHPGLPATVQNLIVACYAIQADKAWLRAGHPMETPKLDKISDDMMLRGQELPSEEEFERASVRAAGIFRIARLPVRNARSVQALASGVRRKAEGRLVPARELTAELEKHAATLGLDGEQPRMATSGAVALLLAKLAATTDDTETLRVLAAAQLPRENAIYLAHMDSAETLTTALRTRNWQVLDQLAASEGDTDAAVIVSALQQAARHDEHEVPLGAPLCKADQDAIALVMSRVKRPEQKTPVDVGKAGPGPELTETSQTVRVHARDVPRLVEKICEAADENPAAEFEITWRIVDR